MPEFYLGFIFAGYSVSMWVFSPLFSILLTKFGRKNILLMGCICECIAIVIFGMLIWIKDPFTYGISCFFCRMIEGFGNGCLSSSSNSLISYYYEEDQSKLISTVQTFTGIGMLSGPMFGSLLVHLGGYQAPFFTTGAALGLLVIPVGCFILDDTKVIIVKKKKEEEGPVTPR